MSDILNDLQSLRHFMADNPRLTVLTGAGISLAGGIPTYRDESGTWRHSEPVKHREFLQEPARRQRYWARSMRGWPPVRDALPTRAHAALAALEQDSRLELLITQNVDRLHQRAGSRQVIDLHGRLDRVCCLDCGSRHCRNAVQQQLEQANGDPGRALAPRPDGDADLPEELERQFVVPACPDCAGTLMPDVVFFGGTVPGERVQACMAALERSDALLVVGSSLQVFSGFRFCRRASELGKPIAIINPGTTRADALATLKLKSDCQQLLAGVSKAS